MLDFPIGQFLLYCAFVIVKKPASYSSSRLLKYYPYGRTCSAAASAFVAAVSVF